jgi:hypothetical protein
LFSSVAEDDAPSVVTAVTGPGREAVAARERSEGQSE